MKYFHYILICAFFFGNQTVLGQEESIIVKFTGEDIEFTKLKVFKIIGAVYGIHEPKIYECGGVSVIYVDELEDKITAIENEPIETEQSHKPKKTAKPKDPKPEILSDTILKYNVDSNGFLKLNTIEDVYYQYKKGCVYSVNIEKSRFSGSDTIFINIPKNENYVNKIEFEGFDVYRFSHPTTVCRNKKIYQEVYFEDLIKKGFSRYEVKEELIYSDSTLEFYEKIKNGNWYHFNDTLSKKGLNTYDIRKSIRKYQLEYPEKAEKFQLEGLIVFKLILTYDNKIENIELVYGNDPILVTETARFLGQYNYFNDWNCHVKSYFKHFFDKIPEELNTEVYLPFEYTIRGLRQFHEEYKKFNTKR